MRRSRTFLFALVLLISGCRNSTGSRDGEPDADPDGELERGLGESLDASLDGTDADTGRVRFVRNPDNPLYRSSGQIWDYAGIGDPSVLYDSTDVLFKAWLSVGGRLDAAGPLAVRTGALVSYDGVAWQQVPGGPVFKEGAKGEWDQGGVETVCVLREANNYLLYYGAYREAKDPPVGMQIGVATSSDGVHWERSPQNPVLPPGKPGAWDQSWVESPTVIHLGDTYYMWYSGVDWSRASFAIGLATSPDGVTWTRHPANPVFSAEPSNSWENGAVYAPSVVYDGHRFVMFYVGLNDATFLDEMRIGMATSPDGVNWTREPSNPVLDPGPPGAWDEKGPFVPSVLIKDGVYYLYYLSGSNPNEAIGLSTWTP
ncbi:MAG: family 43 glycosylhydrolase [Deltaproteobacteria bacterium]|nr:family 43 glycosylhydrolase [Deltaproteobacteria bacterium]